MIKLEQPIIVEGKYDKITLENVVDALIIPTNGFSIFKDKEKCSLIRTFAKKSGVIVLTDSDSAGNLIRSYLKKIVDGGKIINVYVPRLSGKEKRKEKPGKEGILGVEGMKPEVIISALENCGVFWREIKQDTRKITKTDMFIYGLSGTNDSSERRKQFLEFSALPKNLSSNAMLDVLNTMFTYEEFVKRVALWEENRDKK